MPRRARVEVRVVERGRGEARCEVVGPSGRSSQGYGKSRSVLAPMRLMLALRRPPAGQAREYSGSPLSGTLVAHCLSDSVADPSIRVCRTRETAMTRNPLSYWKSQDRRRDSDRPVVPRMSHGLLMVTILLWAGTMLMTAAVRTQAQEWKTYPIAEAPAELRPVIKRGDMAIITLQNAVLSELTREFSRGGPGVAIRSCHLDVTAAAQRIARQEGIAAGRTSSRLRNPLNAPRPWAAPVVQKYAGHRAAGIDGFAVDLGDRVGVMRPILQRTMCSGCHGPADELSPLVRAELQDRYPVDRATGFREGDLRGWFWVEVPKKQ